MTPVYRNGRNAIELCVIPSSRSLNLIGAEFGFVWVFGFHLLKIKDFLALLVICLFCAVIECAPQGREVAEFNIGSKYKYIVLRYIRVLAFFRARWSQSGIKPAAPNGENVPYW
jgi:hypothetical protein